MKQLERFYADTIPSGTPLITRDGREVSEWYYFESANNPYPVKAVVDGQIYTYTKDGTYYKVKIESVNDLFIKPNVKECWANIYRYPSGNIYVFATYSREEDALNNKDIAYNYIKTIKITDEVE